MASLAERFEAQGDRTGEHHRWLGARDPERCTGRLKVDGRQVTAHRLAWELANGPVPAGARVLACGELAQFVAEVRESAGTTRADGRHVAFDAAVRRYWRTLLGQVVHGGNDVPITRAAR